MWKRDNASMWEICEKKSCSHFHLLEATLKCWTHQINWRSLMLPVMLEQKDNAGLRQTRQRQGNSTSSFFTSASVVHCGARDPAAAEHSGWIYLRDAIALAHQVIYQLIGQSAVFGLAHLLDTRTESTSLDRKVFAPSFSWSTHSLYGHLHSQVVFSVGTLEEVAQGLKTRRKEEENSTFISIWVVPWKNEDEEMGWGELRTLLYWPHFWKNFPACRCFFSPAK